MKKALSVGRKEFRQIVRDRRTLLILLFVPAFFLVLYGYALNFDIRHIRLAVEDNDRTSESRALISAFINSGYFDFAGTAVSDAAVVRMMNSNDVRAVLVIPAGFGRDMRTNRRVPVQVLINGDNANTATTVMGYAMRILQQTSLEFTAESRGLSFQLNGSDVAGPIRVEPRVWFNPELRSTLFLVPGLIAYIAMLTAVVSTSLSIVREKERGTMEQVRMAPIGTISYTVGKTIPHFVISMCSSFGIVLASMALFRMPMRGSWLLLFVAIALFLAGALAVGLLVSTLADSQQVAFQLALLTSFLPTLMLSGFIFPISSMPAFVQAITYVVPARYFIVALRGILLKGVGAGVLWVELTALAGFAALMLLLASARLRREWA
jgi:drug efflux transport system permease protein